MNYDVEKTATIIKKLRSEVYKVQETVANEMEINIKTYQAAEQGTRGVKIDTLCIIADYYHVTLDYLITGNYIKGTELDSIMNKLPAEKQERFYKLVSNLAAMMCE